jgi:hypothetical protein
MGHYLGGRRKAKVLPAMPEFFWVDTGKQSPLESYTLYVEQSNSLASLPRFVVLWFVSLRRRDNGEFADDPERTQKSKS